MLLPPATLGPLGHNWQVLVNTAVFRLHWALLIEHVIAAVCCCYLCCLFVVQNVNTCKSCLFLFQPYFVGSLGPSVLHKSKSNNFCHALQKGTVYKGHFTLQQPFNETVTSVELWKKPQFKSQAAFCSGEVSQRVNSSQTPIKSTTYSVRTRCDLQFLYRRFTSI